MPAACAASTWDLPPAVRGRVSYRQKSLPVPAQPLKNEVKVVGTVPSVEEIKKMLI